MSKVLVLVNHMEAGILEELKDDQYQFTYHSEYTGAPISLTMPVNKMTYKFDKFPAFFEGLLPEGMMLEALLHKYNIDRNHYLTQLIKVGHDMVGAITIKEIK